MAVVVQCYHCNTILELDEGFRGGVCRCSTCGSLLQVPKASTSSAPKARPAAPGAQPTSPQRPASPGDSGGLSRGQFDPGNEGAGSSGKRPAIPDLGGSSSGLRSGRPAAPTATAQSARRVEKVEPVTGATHPAPHLKQVKRNNMLLLVSFALLGVIAIGAVVVAIVMVMKSDEKRPERGAPAVVDGGKPAPAPRGTGRDVPANVPSAPVTPAVAAHPTTGFLDIPLVGKKIVISIDGASSMTDDFDYVRNGVYQAMNRLGPGQELRVALWRDDKVIPFPKKGFVGKSGVSVMQNEFGVVPVRGSSDAASAMKASLELGADQVIFVTAKPEMDFGIAATVLEGNKSSARLDAVKLDAADSQSPLEELAKKTGGTFHLISNTQLQDLTR